MNPKAHSYNNPLPQPNHADATGRQVCGKIKNKMPDIYLDTYSREPTSKMAKPRAGDPSAA